MDSVWFNTYFTPEMLKELLSFLATLDVIVVFVLFLLGGGEVVSLLPSPLAEESLVITAPFLDMPNRVWKDKVTPKLP